MEHNLPLIQNMIHKDRASYKSDFYQQYTLYKEELEVFLSKPNESYKLLSDLIMFISQTCTCYPESVEEFSKGLHDALDKHATSLNPDMRMVMCRALILLRNKGRIKPLALYQLFFKLFRCKSKVLRSTLYNFIIQDIKRVNTGHKDNKLNRSLQGFMYKMVADSDGTAVDMSLRVMVELYNRRIWNDEQTVDVIKNAWFSKFSKVKATALKFFLGTDEKEDEEDSDSGEDGPTSRSIIMRYAANKKTAKEKKKRDKAIKALRRNKKKKNKKPNTDFSAIQLLRDPNSDAERLYSQLEKSNESFELRLLMIMVLSRIIGVHRITLLKFYSFLQRFLQPHQREVTKILLAAAQASHDEIFPEALEPIIKTIANNFITERNSSDVMAVGLNSVREICARCPLVMNQDLLQDLTQYKQKHDKTVTAAARSLIQLYRRIDPKMLMRKDRGRPTEASREIAVTSYGERIVQDFIPGSEALPSTSALAEEEESEDDGWEEASDDGSCDGSWHDVSSDEDAKMDEEPEEIEEDEEIIAEKVEMAKLNSQTRIFSQKEFEAMRGHQAVKEITPAYSKKNKKVNLKRKAATLNEDSTANTELVPLDKIETVRKAGGADRESKMAVVLASREGREAFGRKKTKMDPFASTTNKQKVKNKQFMMLREKAKKKTSGRSFREKQIALQKAMLKRAKHYK